MVDGVMAVTGSNTFAGLRQTMFQKLDANKDGVIDKTEILAALNFGKKQAAQKESPTLDQAFAKLDTNKDGVISESEFRPPCRPAAQTVFFGPTSALVDFLTTAGSYNGRIGGPGQSGERRPEELPRPVQPTGEAGRPGAHNDSLGP